MNELLLFRGLLELLKPQPQRLFTHLVLELPVLEEPELVLPLQLVSVNVVQVHLKARETLLTPVLLAFFSPGAVISLSLPVAYPVSRSCREGGTFFHVGFEELVGKMLCKKCKHQAGTLRVWDEVSPHQKLLGQEFRVRQLLFTWEGQKNLT